MDYNYGNLYIWYSEPVGEYPELFCNANRNKMVDGKVKFEVNNGAWDGILDTVNNTFYIELTKKTVKCKYKFVTGKQWEY